MYLVKLPAGFQTCRSLSQGLSPLHLPLGCAHRAITRHDSFALVADQLTHLLYFCCAESGPQNCIPACSMYQSWRFSRTVAIYLSGT